MFEKLRKIIADQLNTETEKITMESDFKNDLKADSLDLFELVMAIGDEFGTEIPTEDLEKLHTVGDVAAYLEEKGVKD